MVSDLILAGKQALRIEAEALGILAEELSVEFEKACGEIYSCSGTVLLSGMGKSGLVARKWASTFASTGTNSYFINPAEAQHGDLGIIRRQDLLIALSFSGETQELGFILRHAKELEIPIIGVTGNPKSSLANQSSLCLILPEVREACPLNLAPTTSSTLMMALGDALAVTLMRLRNFTEEDFAKLHPGGALGRRIFLTVRELMRPLEELPIVSPTDPLADVLIEMTQKHLGLAIVMDGMRKSVLGIITDGDLRRFLQKKGIKMEAQADVLMTKSPKSIRPDELASEAARQMSELEIHHLLVEEEEKGLVGVIHLDELIRAKLL